ncbi:maleylpyruvate isomerase family mycothiol-dependent enzyme [Streptomyces kaniharaensis]|uniref:Maleylpyruvate isomerase family mycothiol-dependent enzyme n=1 Tax=Streptomyces kaniharaensis TaxID=212423 RepID=A0A6N7KZC6_9ACTN|nr:maleylpyruvate isomerase family mycothiol-dependent enzyme [Streptomyces kaniharaensis]MQS15618.1 maleylpyruvate isomerase family mycothiol-dependent enzyme [Streptomyces kaniharaensis]
MSELVPALLDDVRASAARIGAALDGLSDAQAREPSALPGWSRGHVLTHLARSADAYRWLLALARTGTEPGPRADAATLDRRLREGAERDAAVLVADLRDSLDRLLDEASSLPAERWSVLVSALAGWRHPAWFTLHRARRELEVHHVDLDLGYTPAAWPAGFVTWALDETAAALAAREFPVARIEAADLDRAWTLGTTGPTVTGSGHALLAWLAGRRPDADLGPEGSLPPPPPWPLPPVPGWR